MGRRQGDEIILTISNVAQYTSDPPALVMLWPEWPAYMSPPLSRRLMSPTRCGHEGASAHAQESCLSCLLQDPQCRTVMEGSGPPNGPNIKGDVAVGEGPSHCSPEQMSEQGRKVW